MDDRVGHTSAAGGPEIKAQMKITTAQSDEILTHEGDLIPAPCRYSHLMGVSVRPRRQREPTIPLVFASASIITTNLARSS